MTKVQQCSRRIVSAILDVAEKSTADNNQKFLPNLYSHQFADQ